MEQPLSEGQTLEIRLALEGRGVSFECPVCHRGQLRVADHFGAVPVPDDWRTLEATSTGHIPCVITECSNCGFVRLHLVQRLEETFGSPSTRAAPADNDQAE